MKEMKIIGSSMVVLCNTKYKLNGAEYFLNRIREKKIQNQLTFIYDVEAFCFFIRAVGTTLKTELEALALFFSKSNKAIISKRLNELVDESRGRFLGHPIYGFIKKTRDNIKYAPIKSRANIELVIDGKIAQDIQLISDEKGIVAINFRDIKNWTFEEWPGDENVIELCEKVFEFSSIEVANIELEINNLIQ